MTRFPFTGRYGLAAVLPVSALCVAATAGCGGHHNSSNSNTATITATIDWPDRSRDITNVSSGAVAAIITAETGDPSNGDNAIDFAPILRSGFTDPATGLTNTTTHYTTSWSSPSTINYGTRTFQIRFYNSLPTGSTSGVSNSTIASSYASTPSVGDATITVNVNSSKVDLGNVTMSGTVASISLAPTTVNFGNTTVLGATAMATGTPTTTLALTPGSYLYSVPVNPYVAVDSAGNVTGTGLGAPVTVTAKVTSGGPTTAALTTNTDVTTTSTITTIVGVAQLTTLSSGLQGRDTVVGAGAPAAAGTSVSVTYTGYYSNDPTNNLDGGNYTAFDTTYATTTRTVTIGDGTLPAGLDQAITGMLPGGTRIVVIPPAQAAGIGIPAAAPSGAPAIYIIQRSN